VLLALAAGASTLGLLEGGLWLFHPLAAEAGKRAHRFLPSYYAMSPAPRVIDFDPGPLAGVTPGVRHVQVNQYGFLYPEAKRRRAAPDEIRIAAVGGSTTECVVLPEDRRWPAVLEELLRPVFGGRAVTVLNLGLSAIDTRTHLATMSQHITDLDVDLVVFLLGANDLSRAGDGLVPLLSPDNFYEPPPLGRVVTDLLRRTQIGRHIALWRNAHPDPPRDTPYFAAEVIRQAALPVLQPPPRFTSEGLAGYARAIVSLAGLCREHGITPLFATQPTMLTVTPTDAERAVVWGLNNGNASVAPADFVALLDQINRCLVATCTEHRYACVDLSQAIPTGLACFYDQVHFNEPGARKVAEALAPRVGELVGQRPARH
jgi:lysophospholipase L1-like esterase